MFRKTLLIVVHRAGQEGRFEPNPIDPLEFCSTQAGNIRVSGQRVTQFSLEEFIAGGCRC